MASKDVISRWAGTVQFPIVSTPRSITLTASVPDGTPRGDDVTPWDYFELDARGVKGVKAIYYALNGRTASSALQSTFTSADGAISTLGAASLNPNFRLPPDSVDRVFARVTSLSVMMSSASNTISSSTVVYINVGKF